MVFAVLPLILFCALFLVATGILSRVQLGWRRSRTHLAVRRHLVLLSRRRLPLGPGVLALAKELGVGNRWQRRETAWIQGLAQRLDAEGSLWRAVQAVPGLYTEAELAVLGAAEQKGALAQALEILFAEETSGRERRAHVAGLLFYPRVTTALTLGVLLFSDMFIVPKFKVIFESVDTELPLLTQEIFDLGAFLEDYWFVIAVAAVVAAFIDFGARRAGFDIRRSTRNFAGSLAARLPFLGRTVRQRTHGRWLVRAATLLDSGSTLGESLEVARAGAPRACSRALASAARKAREGEPVEKVLATAFGRDGDELVPAVLLVASDGLPAALRETGQRLTDRSSRRVDALLKAFEFVPMLPAAVLVAAHFCGVFLPVIEFQGALIP